MTFNVFEQKLFFCINGKIKVKKYISQKVLDYMDD